MGVYIKDMEMPTRCFNCPLCEISDAEICCSISIGVAVKYTEIDEQIAIQDKPSWCPLVEVKTPHGRLIEAEMVKAKSFRYLLRNGLESGRLVFWRNIDDAPTIIESEGDDGNS